MTVKYRMRRVAIDDTPVDGKTNRGVSSNWAYDHVAGSDTHTLTSPVINGTVTTTGLTLPAFTAGGNVSMAFNKLQWTNFQLYDNDINAIICRNAADSEYAGFSCGLLRFSGGLLALADAVYISAIGTDDNYLTFKAKDNTVGSVEVARLQGAADPYFQMTLAMRLNPIPTASLPATPVEGMLVYDDTTNKLKVYNGTAWETVTSA